MTWPRLVWHLAISRDQLRNGSAQNRNCELFCDWSRLAGRKLALLNRSIGASTLCSWKMASAPTSSAPASTAKSAPMSELLAEPVPGGVRIPILVQPKSSRNRFGPIHGDRIKVAITSPPVDGAANKAVVDLLAKVLGVARRDVCITAGHTSRRKTVEVLGITVTSVAEAIA